MPTLKLTETAIEKMKTPDPSGKQNLFWDSELRGFAVLVSGTSNSKSYIVQRAIGIGGKQRRLTVADARTLPLKEARFRAAEMLDGLRRGADPKQKKTEITLRIALEMYLCARKDLRPATVQNYTYTIEHYCSAWLDRPIREITTDMVEKRHRAIAAEMEKKYKASKSAHAALNYKGESTANAAMRAFGVLWNYCANPRRIADLGPSPVRELKKEKQWFDEPRRERFVKAGEMPGFYEAVVSLPNPVARDYLLLMLFTGMRRGETATLAWDDIDFEERIIRVAAKNTKANRQLELPMTDFVFDLLSARAALGKDKFVFPASGKAGHIADPFFPLEVVRQKTGLKISAHDLRRTYLRVAHSLGVSMLDLKAMANHSMGSDVTAGYINVSVEDLRAPAQRIADRLKELCGIAPPMLRFIRSPTRAA
jgi:integrase